MKMSTLLCTSFLIVLLVSLTGNNVYGYRGDTVHLKEIPAWEIPEIRNNELKVTINFVFDGINSDYYMYFNKEKEMLVFEFIGIHIDELLPVLKDTSIIKRIFVENTISDVAFNSMMTRLYMAVDTGWYSESWVLAEKVLRLSLWRTTKPLSKSNGWPKLGYWKYVATGVLLFLVTIASITAIEGKP